MEKNKINYKEVQIFWLAIIFILPVVIFLIVAYLYQLRTKPITLFPTILGVVVFTLILLAFYKMTITINTKNVYVSFGAGEFIKKVIPISEIKRIKKVNIPWYFGMGIRLMSGGVIYNTKNGNGIKLDLKSKKYIIGTNKYNKIQEIINQIQKKHQENA